MPLTNADHSSFNWSRFAHTEYLLNPMVSNLSLEAQGAYMRLLAHSARQVPFGSLPADADLLISMLGVKFKKGGKDELKLALLLNEALQAGFTFCQDKRWYCKMLVDQLPSDANQPNEKPSKPSKKSIDPTLSTKRSEAAAKSHETRRAKKLQSELQTDDAKIANLQNQIAKIANDDVLQNLQDAKIANDLQNGGIKGGELDSELEKDLEIKDQKPSCATAAKASAAAVDAMFSVFWTAYPRKIGKKDAIKAFQKIKPSDDLLQTILDALAKQSKSHDWVKEGGRFIPHPTTWLNGERWNDAVQTNVTPPAPQQRPLNPHSQIRANRAAAMAALNEPSILDVTPTHGGQS